MQDLVNKKDEELVLLSQKGEIEATEELLRRYKNAVRARARKFFFAGGETDDLVQEGMIGLYNAIGAFDGNVGKSFKNFAYLCVTRRIYSVLRTAGNRLAEEIDALDPDTLVEKKGNSPEQSLIDGEERAEFHLRLMKELSNFEFRVVTMYLDGMSYAEICAATGKPFKSVDNALSRSKKKLLRAYGANK